MKITVDELAALNEAIKPFDTDERRARYIAGDFPRADTVKDLDKRYRWDLLNQVDNRLIALAGGVSFTSRFYAKGYNDSHIDTALRNIVKPLDKENN